ncbi:MAG: GNAT family N-acetyltransferase [Enterococcus sp.]
MTLEKVAIISSERGNQYGKYILDKAREIAGNEHIKQIDIGIIKANTRLREWYQKHGYQIVRSQNFTHLPFEVLYMKLDLTNEVANG